MAVTFHQRELANGLRIIAEVDPAAHTAAIGFFVRTGARDERPDVMGVSHFLEHMMFKGTDRRSSDDVNREFDELGARSNAYTSTELTAFHTAVLPEFLPKATDILADMMRPALREADFSTERGVILEEIAMYKDEPFWVLYERCCEEHFGKHPMSHRVLGTTETISALSAPQMRTYFADRYSADNTVVALAGRLDFDAACADIDARCGPWQRTSATRNTIAPRTGGRTFEIRSEKVARAYTMLMADAPGFGDERRYAAFVLAQALGGTDNSRLHWALVETGLAEEASSDCDPHDGFGTFRVLTACEPEREPEVWSIVEREIAGLAESVTHDDVERIRAKVATGVTLAGERPDGRMHRLGRQWTYLHNYSSLEEELERINAVTVDSVRSLLREMPWTPRTVGRLLPGK
ncbi:MAG: M16 family metallopeptidase [Phycisphaerales bacterium]